MSESEQYYQALKLLGVDIIDWFEKHRKQPAVVTRN